MKSTLQKLSTTNFSETSDNIISIYNNQWHCVVNFIYFSQIVSQKVFSSAKKKTEKEKEYKKLILKWDFLLPDGIALQVFYYIASVFWAIKTDKKRLPNMNWTDFTPYFLNDIKQKYWSQKINILLYWATPKVVEKVKENISLKWYNVIYIQDWFSEFDWEKAETALSEYQDTINVLLVARSTPKIPIQELRTSRNYQKILLTRSLGYTAFSNQWERFQKPVSQNHGRSQSLLKSQVASSVRHFVLSNRICFTYRWKMLAPKW